jgi:hypothetical protein
VTIRRLLLFFPVLALAGVLLPGSSALAGNGGGNGNGDDNDDGRVRVVLSGRVEVEEDETLDNVVIFNGPALIAGHVKENVVAFNGNIRVTGQVDDNVIAFNGQAIILGSAEVGGDVRSSDEPVVAQGAQVDGDVEEINFADVFSAVGVIFYILWWIALTISLLVLGLLFLWLAPRAAEAAVEVARTRVGASIGWGLAMFFGLPILSVIVLFTLLGAPLGFVGLFMLVPLVALGYVTSAYFLGRLILKKSNRFLAFLVGWGILRFVELVPVLGHLLSFAAIVYGIGALTVAAWRAAHATGVREPATAATA